MTDVLVNQKVNHGEDSNSNYFNDPNNSTWGSSSGSSMDPLNLAPIWNNYSSNQEKNSKGFNLQKPSKWISITLEWKMYNEKLKTIRSKVKWLLSTWRWVKGIKLLINIKKKNLFRNNFKELSLHMMNKKNMHFKYMKKLQNVSNSRTLRFYFHFSEISK